LDDLCLSEPEASCPWFTIFEEAQNHYYGSDDFIEDYTEALRLFRQAAKLGALSAYGYIGRMYEDGEGVREDLNKAIEFYKEGARKGSVYCYWAMGMLFRRQENDINAEKSFNLFLKNKPDLMPNGQIITELELSSVFNHCVFFVKSKIDGYGNIPHCLNRFIEDNLTDITAKAKSFMERDENGFKAVFQYFDSL